MKIERAFALPAMGGYFNDDLKAIRAGARTDGFFYEGGPVTPGFRTIRQPSEAASVVFILSNGQVVSGDAMSVEYAGAGGRLGPFRSETQVPLLNQVCEDLTGETVSRFLSVCDKLEAQEFDPGLHKPAAMYAVSQALLQAVAASRQCTCAEALAEELGVAVSQTPIPINVQCGDQRRVNVDKAILKRASALPHGLINDIEGTLGRHGELLEEYVSWISKRIQKFGASGYVPEIHIDVYGLIGQIFDDDPERMGSYIASLGERAMPYQLCIETPVLMNTRDSQIEKFAAIRRRLARAGSLVKLIVDEWANDLDDIRAFIAADATDMINVKSPDLGAVGNAARAVMECWKGGLRPILGGSCTDTDQSARIIAHVALASKPAWVLARPGMGIDEGMQIVSNEMARSLAIIRVRSEMPVPG
jgi:methylaspartate ammonia-lyase